MSRRFGVSKHGSAAKFRRDTQKTKIANMNRTVMRGGWRL